MNTSNFDRSFELLTGHRPYPWQRRLCPRLMNDVYPIALDMPTGVGKTEVMAVWLLARAAQPKVPRRLMYVTGPDCLLDHASQVARTIREALSKPELQDLRDGLGLTTPSLPISTAWGPHTGDPEWLRNPSAPAIVVGSVDTIGSALLFEGFGVPRTLRPWMAGLLGCDSLFVLDDAGLSEPFEALLEAVHIQQCRQTHPRDGGTPRCRVMTMSSGPGRRKACTPGQALDKDDIEDPVLAKRLQARKLVTIEKLEPKAQLHAVMAQHAWTLGQKKTQDAHHGTRTLVYCNDRTTARKVTLELTRRVKKTRSKHKVLTLPTAMRCRERTELAGQMEDAGLLGGATTGKTRAVFVVATREAESGIDLTADHMVCDVVPWERMILRLGRTNRLGTNPATVIVVDHGAPAGKSSTKARIEQHEAVIEILELLPTWGTAGQAGPLMLEEVKKTEQGLKAIIRATSAQPLHPALKPALLDAWSMTSMPEHTGRPAVDPWLHGWVDNEPRTRIVWRKELPEPPGIHTQELSLTEPPAPAEVLETTSAAATDWLIKRAKAMAERIQAKAMPRNGAPRGQARRRRDTTPGKRDTSRDLRYQPIVYLLGPDNALIQSMSIQFLISIKNMKGFAQKLSARLLLVDARLGGLENGQLNAETSQPATTRADWKGETWPAEDAWGETLQNLDQHHLWTAHETERLSVALGLSDHHRQNLLEAAAFHDEGKRSRRCQEGAGGPADPEHDANVRQPGDHTAQNGYRHEFESLIKTGHIDPVKERNMPVNELALHLMVAHHGFARPAIHTGGCEDLPPSRLEAVAAGVAERFQSLQQQNGHWGLAWLEALLRAADWKANSRFSEQHDHRTQTPADQSGPAAEPLPESRTAAGGARP